MEKIHIKFYITLILIVTIGYLTSCESSDKTYEYILEEASEMETSFNENNKMTDNSTGEILLSDFSQSAQFRKEDLLEDFDFMMQTMEETFPYFGVAERKLNLDIRALAKEIRIVIKDYPTSLYNRAEEFGLLPAEMPDLDAQVLQSILEHEFFSQLQLSHASARNFHGYYAYQSMQMVASPTGDRYIDLNSDAFKNPNSQRFYEEQEVLWNTLAKENEALFQFLFRSDLPADIPSTSAVVSTNIIEQNKIACLKVSTFFVQNPNDYSFELRNFYKDIQEYEHLIIDIRNNFGGSLDFPRNLIIYPLWQNRENMDDLFFYTFHKGSQLGEFFGEALLENQKSSFVFKPENDNLLLADKLLEAYPLPNLNKDDLKELTYGNIFNASLNNVDDQRQAEHRIIRTTPIPPYQFSGKIWLLINELNYSNAAMFAYQAKEMGFATLVGEPVGGSYTVTPMTHFTLPNTGILVGWDTDYLVDTSGYSLEEFPTTPHYFNREGFDALETVLQIIQEGAY